MPCDAASEASSWRLQCIECGSRYSVTLDRVLCSCGGAFDLIDTSIGIAGSQRVGTSPIDPAHVAMASMASGATPLLPASVGATTHDRTIWFKCDNVMPSGSFKDRGSVMLAALALEHGAKRIVLDSSGNAGASMAMHAARLRIPCEVYVPAYASAGKLRQIAAYGSVLHLIPGARERAYDAAIEAALAPGAFYASHALNPFFIHGVKSWAFEVVSQLGGAPDAVFLPYGSGSLVLGAALGFQELHAAGRIAHVPRINAVRVDFGGADAGVAEGVAVSNPWRARQIEQVIRGSGGSLLSVDTAEVRRAHADLAQRGLYAETTGAVAWAAARLAPTSIGTVVVALTGSGLKEHQ